MLIKKSPALLTIQKLIRDRIKPTKKSVKSTEGGNPIAVLRQSLRQYLPKIKVGPRSEIGKKRNENNNLNLLKERESNEIQ